MSSGLDAGAVDRISDLPESIIGHILSFLRTKDAVAASLLSKRWKLIWTTEVTTFDIEATDHVDKVLGSMNVESISKFCLSCQDVKQSIHKGFDDSVSAIPRMVGVLKVLDLTSAVDRYDPTTYRKLDLSHELPAEIFSCKNLEVLKLGGQFILKLPRAVCFPKLAELELSWVDYHESSEMTVSELISSCPALQSLTIQKNKLNDNDRILTVSSLSLKRLYFNVYYNYRVERKLTIEAPSLEYLFLYDWAADDVCFRGGLPSVNELYLRFDIFSVMPDDQIVGLLEAFQVLKIMKLSFQIMLALDKATKKLSANFETLTTLEVQIHDRDSHQSNQLVDLMDRCVNLRVLKISCGIRPCWPSHVVFPRCLSSSLKRLEVTFDTNLLGRANTADIRMIEFILNHASMLETVHLDFYFYVRSWERLRMNEILKTVLMTPKASPTCKFFRRFGFSGPLKPWLPQQSRKVGICDFQHRISVTSQREKWATRSKNRNQYRFLR